MRTKAASYEREALWFNNTINFLKKLVIRIEKKECSSTKDCKCAAVEAINSAEPKP